VYPAAGWCAATIRPPERSLPGTRAGLAGRAVLSGTVDVGAVVDPRDFHGVVDPVHHPVAAGPRRVTAGEQSSPAHRYDLSRHSDGADSVDVCLGIGGRGIGDAVGDHQGVGSVRGQADVIDVRVPEVGQGQAVKEVVQWGGNQRSLRSTGTPRRNPHRFRQLVTLNLMVSSGGIWSHRHPADPMKAGSAGCRRQIGWAA